MPRRGDKKSKFPSAYSKFLKELRKARSRAGLTQVQAAEKLKKPQSYVSKCEAGERRVDVVELIQFCRAYRVTPSDFIGTL